MAVKLTKNELKVQKDRLKQFQRYLPTLQLKKQQLQAVVMQVTAQLEQVEQQRRAAVAGLEMPASYYEKLQALYTEKRDHFLAGLDRVGLKHNVPQGTYFVMIDISDFLALPQFKGWTDLQFCEWMIREVGVAAVPGSSFFREPVNHLIRMHFARGTDVLDEAVRRLEKLQAFLK